MHTNIFHNAPMKTHASLTTWLVYIFAILAIIFLGGAIYLWLELETATEDARQAERVASERIAMLEGVLAETEQELSVTTEARNELSDDLTTERNRNDEFADQISEISGTVTILDKLSKTDEELLQKYSKVYFLNEHYIPSDLDEIPDTWKYTESREHQIHGKVLPFFEDMLEDAKDDGINLWVVSSYRSFDQQAQLKGAYTVTYGAGANAFSADQGFSEHQLGTTVDFTTTGLGGGLNGFQNTPAYEWLLNNAHEYGFTLSYSEDNSYYVFEPWHWRFVGEDLAEDLNDADAHFYDWTQREIDEYLISIFD